MPKFPLPRVKFMIVLKDIVSRVKWVPLENVGQNYRSSRGSQRENKELHLIFLPFWKYSLKILNIRVSGSILKNVKVSYINRCDQ